MTKRIVLVAPEREALEGPLVFLAGPTWTDQWQLAATALLAELDPTIHVANPRRPLDSDKDFGEREYAEQVDWETEHLARAGQDGVVLFWLAAERNHRCDRAYAQTTRFELAEWKEKHRLGGGALALGIEPGFTGGRYIRRRFAQDCPAVTVRDTLEATVADAVALIQARRGKVGHAISERPDGSAGPGVGAGA